MFGCVIPPLVTLAVWWAVGRAWGAAAPAACARMQQAGAKDSQGKGGVVSPRGVGLMLSSVGHSPLAAQPGYVLVPTAASAPGGTAAGAGAGAGAGTVDACLTSSWKGAQGRLPMQL
jgi:hypothetical protein